MKKNIENQPENKNTDPLKRRGFLKAATLMGLGTIAAGTVKGYANASQSLEEKKAIGTILTKKRILGSRKNPLEVSAIQLGCMGMTNGRGVHPDRKSMIKLIRDAADRCCDFFRYCRNLWPICK